MHFLAFLVLPLATALTISQIVHSGPACPSSSSFNVTAITDTLPVLRLSVPGVSAAAGVGNGSTCNIGLTIDDGEVGQSLVLETVEVWGRLELEEGGRGRLLTSAFWSEKAEDLATTRTNTSTVRAFSDNIYVTSSLNLPSPCVGREGYVGILNVGFRVVADDGEVTFSAQETGGRRVAVSEHLGVRWDECAGESEGGGFGFGG